MTTVTNCVPLNSLQKITTSAQPCKVAPLSSPSKTVQVQRKLLILPPSHKPLVHAWLCFSPYPDILVLIKSSFTHVGRSGPFDIVLQSAQIISNALSGRVTFREIHKINTDLESNPQSPSLWWVCSAITVPHLWNLLLHDLEIAYAFMISGKSLRPSILTVLPVYGFVFHSISAM